MKSIVTYQGQKTSIASQILDIIKPDFNRPFYDFCCGSGAISIALVERGMPTNNLYMVDSGPWGLVWQSIGRGELDLGFIEGMANHFMRFDQESWPDILKEMAAQPATGGHIAETFLFLQSGSFGAKAITTLNGKWKHHGFLKPSYRRGSLQPKPLELLERAKTTSKLMRGVNGHYATLQCAPYSLNGTCYIDPPYANSTGYNGSGFDYVSFAKQCGGAWVSDSSPHGPFYHEIRKGGAHATAGIGGNRISAEFLSWVQ